MKGIFMAALLLLMGNANAETVFVTLEKDNALAIVDPEAGKLIKTVAVGQRPRGIAISKDFRQLYIAASDDDTIQVVAIDTMKVVGNLPSGKDPETFAVNGKGDLLFASNEDDSLVTVIDLQKRKAVKAIPVGVEPEGITVSPDEKWVASASEATNMVHWINRKTLAVVDNTLVDPRPRALSFTPDSKQLWVTSEMAGTVTVIDAESRQIIKNIKFEIPGLTAGKIQPVGVVIDEKRQWAYVALGPANRVAQINAQTLEPEKYFLVGQRVWNLAFSPGRTGSIRPTESATIFQLSILSGWKLPNP